MQEIANNEKHDNQKIDLWQFAEHKDRTILQVMERLLTILCKNSAITADTSNHFVGTHMLDMPIGDYLQRCEQYFKCSHSCLVVGIIYMDRVTVALGIVVHDRNVHRMFVCALTLAVKNYEDDVFTNRYYSKVGGFPLSELNVYEREMLTILDYNLHVPPTMFDEYSRLLML